MEYRHFKKTHQVIEHSNENNIEKLVWKKPGSSNCAVYYLLYGGSLVVLGDLGDAIYKWYSSINLEWITTCNLGYFSGKCEASEKGRSGNNYDWDEDLAEKELKEIFSDMDLECLPGEIFEGSPKPESNDNDELYKLFVENYEWEYELNEHSWACFVNNNSMDKLFFDQDAWEYIFNIGRTIFMRPRLHLEGLQKAFRWIEKDCYHMWN